MSVERSRTYAGAVEGFTLEEELTAGLQELSRREGTTLYMTVLGGWAALLGRLSGQEEVVIGTPTANRGRSEIEKLIGFFVNTLALRVDVSGGVTIGELLERVKVQSLGAQQNQEMPFEQVVELMQPVRSLAHSALFQVMFAWQNTEQSRLELEGVEVEPLRFPRPVAKFDMTLSLQPVEGRIRGGVGYATALFERGTVERYVGYLRRLLKGMVEGGRQALVEELPLLSEEERRQVLYGWNETEVEYEGEQCLHELFEEQVRRRPEAVAVVFEGRQLTYAELNGRANQLAHYLRTLGVKPDSAVGLCVERSLEMVVGIVGILKAGGAYVPLEPGYPQERLEYMIADISPAVVLTQSWVRERVEGSGTRLLLLDRAEEELVGYSRENLGRAGTGLEPRHLAYVIYTSGSTGNPKGVMNEHAGVVNRLLWAQQVYGLGSDDRILQKTPFSFDVSVWEFLLPLITGAQLVVARPGGHLDPQYLAGIIERERITMVHFVPSMLQTFLEHGETKRCAGLRRVLCSGEALPYGLQVRFQASLPEVELHNLYGPTEAAIDVTWWVCRAGVHEGIVPIGRPIANTQIYILDKKRQPVGWEWWGSCTWEEREWRAGI